MTREARRKLSRSINPLMRFVQRWVQSFEAGLWAWYTIGTPAIADAMPPIMAVRAVWL